MNSFYTEEELKEIGFKSIGNNVLISKKASIYGAEKISIGNNVRIDDFCILSGKINLGNYIHIAAYSALYGGNVGIILNDFVNISSRVVIYAISDDYSGEFMTNPMIPDEYKNVIAKSVILEKHCIVGSNSTILPGAILHEGVAIGAHSLVNKKCIQWKIYVGVPVKILKDRKRDLLKLENELLIKLKEVKKQ